MKYIINLTVLALLFSSCPKKDEKIVVKVNGSKLTSEEINLQIPPEYRKMVTPADIDAFLNGWVENEILYLEAKRRGVDKEDSVELYIKTWTKRILVEALKLREFNKITITEDDIRRYFDEHKNEFLYALKVSQIILQSFAEAQKTLEEIKAGANFIKLARERSLGRDVNPTGVTDYFTRGNYHPDVEEKVFRMKVGEVSDVIPTPNGVFLIVKVLDRKKMKETVNYSEIRDYIQKSVIEPNRRLEALNELVSQLKANYKIETYPDNFPR